MPIDYKKYPTNWKEIRERILLRAGDKCEFCGAPNHSYGFRTIDGEFIGLEDSEALEAKELEKKSRDRSRDINVIKIVLTIAHLDHDETNPDVKDERLAALCQQCHLRYDVKEKQRRIKNKKAIGRLFE